MWNVDPKILCRQHLLGEHREMHALIGSLRKGRSIKGHIEKGQVEVHNILKRHDALAKEILRRGWRHIKPLSAKGVKLYKAGKVDSAENKKELGRRCPECRILQGKI